MEQISQKLGKGLQTAAKIGTTAIATFGALAIKTFADYEQLIGGSELMFGEAFDTVMNNAKNAYKTVQMSQNEYLTQVNGFATGLKTALGGNEQAAADLAHRIVQAEADIVAATGNTQENVANAFAGIMKSNFTMLDNLQIGITPTKKGFQEVIDKVNEWNEANGEATNYQMDNLADMQSALVDYIEMVGMSGYAQAEASGTILGSFASMKAAASDFMTSLVSDNGDVEGSFETLKETAATFFDNIKPKIMAFLEAISPIATTVAGITSAFVAFKVAASISTLLSALIKSWQAYKVANEGATIAQWLLNAAMNANPIVLIVTLIAGLVGAIVTLWHTNDDFKNALIGAWNAIKKAAVVVWESIVKFFTEDIPNAFNAVIKFVKNNWQALLLFITNPIAGALKLLYNLNPKFKEWVDNLLGKIKSWIGGIVNIGKDIVNGLKKGIQGAWKNLVSWFKGLFGDLIGIAKKILGIASPSKVFKKIGAWTAEGFGDGFNDAFEDVEDDIEKALDFGNVNYGIATAGSSIGSFGGADAVGGLSIVQNIYSEAKSAADLMREALWQQEKAVYLGV